MRFTWLLGAIACIAGMPGISSAAPVDATPKAPAFTQQNARDIIATSRKIVSGHGIETQLAIPVNGTRQWISVRGHDARNPILLFLHGGPASPDMPLA